MRTHLLEVEDALWGLLRSNSHWAKRELTSDLEESGHNNHHKSCLYGAEKPGKALARCLWKGLEIHYVTNLGGILEPRFLGWNPGSCTFQLCDQEQVT